MRVLLATFGSFGDVNPYIAMAMALRDRGHVGVVAAPAAYREVVEREGLPFRALRPDADLSDRESLAKVMDPKRGTIYLLEEVLLPALRESYEDLLAASRDCDVLVSHTLVYAGPIVADATGKPWASSTLQPMAFMSACDPPILSPLQFLAWYRHLGRLPNEALLRLGKWAVRKWVKPIQRLRLDLGLSLGTNPIYEGQFSPHLSLALFSKRFGAAQPDWPKSAVQTGFVTYDGSHGRTGFSQPLREFLDGGDAPVVFSLGTSSVASLEGLYGAGIAAVQELGLRAVIIGDDHHACAAAVGDPNILCVKAAPFRQLLPRASIIVHPGGVGTVGICAESGRPSLLVPVAADHPDNAARLAKLGVARVVGPKRCSAHRIARELEILGRPEWLARAEDFASFVATEPGVAGACEAIERLHP